MSLATKEPQNKNDVAESDGLTTDRQLCEECNEQVSLYQCPGCSIRTCSLQCCKAHKKRTKCSGKRSRGAYLPLCRMSDSTLRSDYFFMEEILDIMPRARKVSKLTEEGKSLTNDNIHSSSSKNPRSIASINKKAKRLVQQALCRGITLQIMPPVLERHKNNSSWYCGSTDLITWKVEVVLVTQKKTFSFNLSEREEGILNHISKCIESYEDKLNMPSILSSDNYQLLIKRLPSSANNPRYVRIKNNDCLKTVLEGFTIVEYPTLDCVTNEDMNDFPVGTNGITEKTPVTSTVKDSTDSGSPV
jgi:hypothetical protein